MVNIVLLQIAAVLLNATGTYHVIYSIQCTCIYSLLLFIIILLHVSTVMTLYMPMAFRSEKSALQHQQSL